MASIEYKVLWVDDDLSIVSGTQLNAEDYHLKLDHYSNWEEAEKALRKDFDGYSAIILDANCKIKKADVEQEEFITAVLPSLLSIFGEKRRTIPWYMLSAGTMSMFQSIVTGAKYQHAKHEEEWGNMLYLKDAPDDSEQCSSKLFANIERVAKDQAMNVVLYRHSDVFQYLGKDKLIDSRARKLMLKMLSALYYPEENIKYEYAGNPLRKVLEYVFRAARKKGLLAEECFDSRDHIVLQDASRYMGGLTVNCYESKKIKYTTRYGNAGTGKEGAGGDTIFPDDIAMISKNTLNYTSSDSHTEEDEPFFIDEANKELFFSFVMQVCHLIKWFGKYVELHPDVNANKQMQQILPPPPEKNQNKKQFLDQRTSTEQQTLSKDKIIGMTYLITKVNGVSVCGKSCKLSDQLKNRSGAVTITALEDNSGDDKEVYPYIVTEVK